MTKSFEELGLNLNIIEGLNKQNITVPTTIQELSIPIALENKDIIGESFTGSGKTLAFLIPIFHKIDISKREMQAIILAPTHELVMQIEEQIKLLATNSNFEATSLSIIGEVNINRQIKKLKEIKPHIIVGTPGRILDLITKRKIASHTIKTIVIDEADNLLRIKTLPIINEIIKSTMRDRQLMCFSATMNKQIIETAQDIMKEPELIKIAEKSPINPNITHYYIICDPREKFETLRKLIAATNPHKSIVFTNDKYDLENVTEKLNYHNRKTFALSGDIDKEKRKQAIESFRAGRINILICSDVAARGMDIIDVTHIFNLDLPEIENEYIHRSGRTARGDNSGICISIATKYQLNTIKQLQKKLKIKLIEVNLFKGKLHEVTSTQINNKK